MKILKVTNSKALVESADIILSGGLIVYPTETAYGLGVDSTNHTALEKLFSYKGNRTSPVSIAVTDMAMAENYVTLSPQAKILYQKYLPGPLTVVSLAKPNVDPLLLAGSNCLGIRIPDNDFVQKLLSEINKPITSTSANISQGETPYSLESYLKNTPPEKTDLIDLFIDAGPLGNEQPSTVVKAIWPTLEIIRQGKIFPVLQ